MTNRRTFIRQTSTLASAWMLGSSFSFKPKYKTGLQLYTIREALSKDVRGTLAKIASYMKQDLPALFKKHPGRFPLWHLKDKDKKNPELHTTMGDGDIDFVSLLSHARQAGAQHLYVEQGNNYVPDDLSCVERSAAYTKKLLR